MRKQLFLIIIIIIIIKIKIKIKNDDVVFVLGNRRSLYCPVEKLNNWLIHFWGTITTAMKWRG